jgi:hypothetical protein
MFGSRIHVWAAVSSRAENGRVGRLCDAPSDRADLEKQISYDGNLDVNRAWICTYRRVAAPDSRTKVAGPWAPSGVVNVEMTSFLIRMSAESHCVSSGQHQEQQRLCSQSASLDVLLQIK